MPIMDGIEATRRIRELEAMTQSLPEGDHDARRRTPIIASTAHAINEVRDKCLAVGMDDFLVKPFDERQMAETLLRRLKPVGGTNSVEPADDDLNAAISGLKAAAEEINEPA